LGFYSKHVLPPIIDLAMRHRIASRRRAVVVPRARGVVLEIGIGSGLNLPFYSAKVSRLEGVDPSPELLAMAKTRASHRRFEVSLQRAGAEDLPFPRARFDTVVSTWTLCSVADAAAALKEIRRVLKPGGDFLFVEHGAAPDDSVRRWQRRLDPVWTRLAGGCHLDRRIDLLIAGAGFSLYGLRAAYLEGPRVLTYTYEGAAERP
jgi:ubiquinone/menaquinone biosynthesis C-methylase UbiE